jgi:hypothetical protein
MACARAALPLASNGLQIDLGDVGRNKNKKPWLSRSCHEPGASPSDYQEPSFENEQD